MDGSVADGVDRDGLVAALAFGDGVVVLDAGAKWAVAEGTGGFRLRCACLLQVAEGLLSLDSALHVWG